MGLPVKVQLTEAERNRVHVGEYVLPPPRIILRLTIALVYSIYHLVSVHLLVVQCSKYPADIGHLDLFSLQALRWVFTFSIVRRRHQTGVRTIRRT